MSILQTKEFPLILSPNLGCPEILALDEKRLQITVIVATTDEKFGKWSLVPSYSNRDEGLKKIVLNEDESKEIHWGFKSYPSSIDETRENISKELYLDALGGDCRIFKVKLSLTESDPIELLRKVDGSSRPAIYDLCLDGVTFERKYHAVCLTESKSGSLRYIHLTDLHIAKRNDFIEQEITFGCGPINGFPNFNENLRKFIAKANEMSDKGELDFVIIGGDLVDFVNHGVADDVNFADNNWRIFIDIMTGGDGEPKRGEKNHGIKVPLFTLTGNHDWRLHPYALENTPSAFVPNVDDKNKLECFDFEYYDTMEALNAKKNNVYENIVKEGSAIRKENLLHTTAKKFLNFLEKWEAKVLVPVIFMFIAVLFPNVEITSTITFIVGLFAYALHGFINRKLGRFIRYLITHAVIPVEAGVHALHYYFLHINPYFNYAFSFGSNHFVMMDTGPDCLVGQYLWDDGNRKMKRISIRDNILGGSPDSMSFYPANEHYTYNQIVWLEGILKNIGNQKTAGNKTDRIFICLHAPSINVAEPPKIPAGNGEVELKRGQVDIRYGTINHYVSQFMHLCQGKKEGDPNYSGPKVDLIFAGHAHQKIEFRIGPNNEVYCGNYSDEAPLKDFDDKKPFEVQAAACGPLHTGYPDPPYFRTINIDVDGKIISFKHN